MLRIVGRLLILIPVLIATLMPTAGTAQEAQPRPQVFAGFVTAFTPEAVSVSRKNASGKEMVHKSFTVDPHTKVEGKIKLNARVTVQFLIDGENNRAVRIIVRGN